MRTRLQLISEYKLLRALGIQPVPQLYHVSIDLCSVCNHHCYFCYFTRGEENIGKAPHPEWRHGTYPYFKFDRVMSLLDELHGFGVKALTFIGGGEPLLHPEVGKVLEKAGERFYYGVSTNLCAQKLDVQWLEKATWVRVSVDAATPDIYDAVHLSGAVEFESMLSNLSRLIETCKGDIGVSFLVCDKNWQEIQQAAILYRGKGARYIQYKAPYDQALRDELKPHSGEINKALQIAKTLADDHFSVIDNFSPRMEDKVSRRFHTCLIQHYGQVQVTTDGEVYPCCLFKYVKEYSLGNVMEQSFPRMWNGKQRKEMAEKVFTAEKCPPCYWDVMNNLLYTTTEPSTPHDWFI